MIFCWSVRYKTAAKGVRYGEQAESTSGNEDDDSSAGCSFWVVIQDTGVHLPTDLFVAGRNAGSPICKVV